MDFLGNIPQYLANGLANGCIYILVAMGFNIIYSSTGIINFAQGEFSMFGGLLAFTFAVSLNLPIPVAIILAIRPHGVFGTKA